MSANVYSLRRRLQPLGDWTNEELAELYRVEHALRQGAFCVETDRGISDEGDPWFVFCHSDGHVVVHIARIDNVYYLFCGTLPGPLTGSSFAALTQAFVNTIPAPKSQAGGRIVAHPSALFSLLIAAAMFSADALLHHPANAASLPRHDLGHIAFGEIVPRGEAKVHALKTFTETFATAIWRDRELEDRRVAATLQVIEQAALNYVSFEPVLAPLVAEPFVGAEDVAGLTAVVLDDDTLGPGDTSQNSLPLDRPSEENTSLLVSSPQGPTASSSAGRLAPLVYSPVSQAQPASEFAAANWDGGSTLPLTTHGGATAGGHTGIVVILIDGGAVIAPTLSGVRELDVSIAGGGGTLDLAKSAGALQLTVSGYGSLTLMHAEAAQSVEMSAGAVVSLDLSYDVTSAPAPLKLKLDGGVHVSLVADQASTPTAGLIVDSNGTQANVLNITDSSNGPPSNFTVVIVGQQDLTLQESAATFNNSNIDASALNGILTVGLDFSQTSSSAMVSFGSGNFAVTPSDSIALENLADNSSVEVGVSLSTVVLGFDAGVISKGGPLSLSVDLNGDISGSPPLTIGVVEVDGASNLAIVSSGTGNVVQSINGAALSNLVLSGNAPLTINQLSGPTSSDDQSVVVDASGLNGFLTLNASAIADSAAGGRQVSIITGAGGASITDTNTTEAVTLTLGVGAVALNVAPGAQLTIAGLTGSDQISIGPATVVDTFINGLAANAAQQMSIDAAGSLSLAAMASAKIGNSTTAHQAVLFSYQGSEYVFVDAVGDHVFHSSLDAIVKLVGLPDTANLSAVFHSA